MVRQAREIKLKRPRRKGLKSKAFDGTFLVQCESGHCRKVSALICDMTGLCRKVKDRGRKSLAGVDRTGGDTGNGESIDGTPDTSNR